MFQEKIVPTEDKKDKKKKKKAESILEQYKDDPKFQEFLRVHKRNDLESWNNDAIVELAEQFKTKGKVAGKESADDDDDKDLTNAVDENKNKVTPANRSRQFFDVKLANLPYRLKKKHVKTFFAPLKPPSIRIPPKIHGIAYVGFSSEKERNLALNKHKSMFEGHQVLVTKYERREDGDGHPAAGHGGAAQDSKRAKWREQEEGLAAAETVGESGRIFARNLAYTVTEDELQELFAKFGPLAEINLPVDKITRRSKVLL